MIRIYDDHSEQGSGYEDEDDENEFDGDESDMEPENQNQSGSKLSVIFKGDLYRKTELPIDPLAEKLFEFSISLIAQQFSQGESQRSPLLYFTSVLGIDVKNGGFRRAGLYTPMIAALLWISRLLVLEYALPKRSYITLQRPSREAYEDHYWRLEEFRRLHLVQGCRSPASRMAAMLAYGKQAAKAEERGGRMAWDSSQETFYIDNIACTVEGFKHFTHGVIKSACDLLYNVLLFGQSQLKIDLNSLKDRMTNRHPGFSLLSEPLNQLSDGPKYMLSLVKQAPGEKALVKDSGAWIRKKVIEYLDRKKIFLELLMLAMLLTGGQPARGPELGSLKFRNSLYSSRNFFVIGGNAFYLTEYNKARASTNYSYFVVRYLPQIVGQLTVIYIAYIRPFCDFLYSEISMQKQTKDSDYLFCSETSPDVNWNGNQLKEIFERESKERLRVWIIPSQYRHIAIAMTRAHVKSISAHFEKDDVLWDQTMSRDSNQFMYAFQAGHQRVTNVSTYGLDQAFPSKLQPELLHSYLQISQIWHQWLGFLKKTTMNR